jgi:N-glycosylase/DNA lyase
VALKGTSPVQFDHVFILKEVIAVDHLALEFPVPPDARILELGEKIMVDMCSEVEQAGSAL